MVDPRYSTAVLLTLAALLFVPIHAYSEDKWTKVESANFQLIGNADDKEIQRVAIRMERFREAFLRLLPSLRHETAVPTTIIVFKNENSFRPYKPLNADGKTAEWVAGYFRSGEDTNYIVLSAERERHQTYQTIYHEYVHFLLGNSFGRASIPAWLNEGIAEYYDQFQMSGDSRITLGSANPAHLESLRKHKLMPFEKFIGIDHQTLHTQAGSDASIFYSQAWALVHLLIHGRPGNGSADLQSFLELLIKGATTAAAVTKAFDLEMSELGEQLGRYVAAGTFDSQVLTLKEKIQVDEGLLASPVKAADAKAILGDLLLGSERYDEAYEHLTRAVAEHPDSLPGNSSLGMWLTKKGRYAEAKKYLSKARSLPGATYLEHYRYAFLISREPMAGRNWISYYPEQTAAEIRSALAKAIEMNPRYPESYRLLAFVSIVRNDKIDESIGHIRKAQTLAPGNDLIRLDLASLLGRKAEYGEAESIARQIKEFGRDPAARHHADYVLENIENLRRNREAIIAAREAKQPGRLPVITEHLEPVPTEAELADLQRTAQMMSLNANLRKPADNEVRVIGELSKIECDRKGTVFFTLINDSARLRFRSLGFEDLYLKTFRAIDMRELGCHYSSRGHRALLTYVPDPDSKTNTAGTLTAIEFVPDFFTLTEGPANSAKKPAP